MPVCVSHILLSLYKLLVGRALCHADGSSVVARACLVLAEAAPGVVAVASAGAS